MEAAALTPHDRRDGPTRHRWKFLHGGPSPDGPLRAVAGTAV